MKLCDAVFYFAALAALSACSARIHDGNHIIYDEGGRVDVYEGRAQTPHEIRGTCISACTLYLRTGCVDPGARLVFHPPHVSGNTMPLTQAQQYWAERITQSYPPALASWYLSDWRSIRTLRGHEAIEMGARQCSAT